MLSMALAIDLIPSEPFVPGIKWFDAVCQISGKSIKISIEKLRKGLVEHSCCKPSNRINKLSFDFEPYPNYVRSGKCSQCGKTALTDQEGDDYSNCGHCSDQGTLWLKGGQVTAYSFGEELLVNLSNGGEFRPERIVDNSKLRFRAQIPPRSPEDFVASFMKYGTENQWKIPSWYLSDWGQGEKYRWRTLSWISKNDQSELEKLALFTLNALSLDTKIIAKASQKKLKKAVKPSGEKSKGNDCVFEASLPMQYAHYPPEKKGMIFAFSESEDSQTYLCDCSKKVIETIKLINNFDDIYQAFSKSTFYFPQRFVDSVRNTSNEEFELRFKPGICHACCKSFPSLMSSTYPHGSFVFRWLYWYDQQECYLNGFDYPYYRQVPDRPQDEFTEYLEIVKTLNTPNFEKPIYQKARDRVRNLINLLVKERFEISALGGSSHAEITILKMVRELLPNLKIVSHHRPDWLLGLEIDIWIPELNIGIEYQGEQHYKPIEIWGGEAGFMDLKARDERKRKLCQEKGVNLIEIRFDQQITKNDLEKLINPK